MRLYEHSDFEQLIIATHDHFGRPRLTYEIIEKDYYVTEVLRILSSRFAGEILFKGGTSLSKGWNLIARFSEDIDLFVNPKGLGKKAIDTKLKLVRNAIAEHPSLEFCPEESLTIGGFGRGDRFSYPRRFPDALQAVTPRVFVETGTSSGTYPTEIRHISSYVATFLRDTGTTIGAEDEIAFEMPLLHFRRTFVEKMFAIHAKVEIFKETGLSIGAYARHYYDLFCLASQPEVIAMLQTSEYIDIKIDYERISLKAFPRGYRQPQNMSFANSDALFPDNDLANVLSSDYRRQCQLLCYDQYPDWHELQATFQEIRHLL